MENDSHNSLGGPQTHLSPSSLPTASTSSLGRERSRAYTARTNTPSPLRYATSYSSTSLSAATSPDLHFLSSPEPNPPMMQDTQPPKAARSPMSIFQWSKNLLAARSPVYSQSTPIANKTLSEMTSSSSAYAVILPLTLHQSTSPPRASGSISVTRSEHPETALTPNRTCHADEHKIHKHNTILPRPEAPELHVSFLPPRRRQPALQIHPLLVHTCLQRSPLAYDVAHPPSPDSLIDRRTRSTILAATLAQPATKPSTPTLVLKSPKFPWAIVATSARANTKYSRSASVSKVRLDNGPVSNLDILHAVHTTLAARVTPQEWSALGQRSRAQRRIMQEYERRCVRAGGGWEEGVRRIDYLCGKTLLIGIEVDKEKSKGVGNQDVMGRLVFTST
ncbi:hypothetical protein FPV67DRAFT_1669330 [Lyophyllum atratum]|nr:hypothetical protein FPV67DRAFT_1669330 [Lyophyllum atratum]